MTTPHLDNVISAQVSHIPGAIVLHDTRIAWDVDGLDPYAPDIALIFNVREHKKWGTFNVSIEDTRPTLIIEVTSSETRQLDLGDKVEEYAYAGVQFYIVIDAHKSQRQPTYRLIGYQLTPDGYVDLQPDEQGRLWLESAQIWLGLRDDQVHCYDAQGNRMGDYARLPPLIKRGKPGYTHSKKKFAAYAALQRRGSIVSWRNHH